jgi:hypothetical protein
MPVCSTRAASATVAGIVEEDLSAPVKSGHALPHLRLPRPREGGYGFSYVDPRLVDLPMFEMMDEEGVTLLLDHTGGRRQNKKATKSRVSSWKMRTDATRCPASRGRLHRRGLRVPEAGAPATSCHRDEVQPHSLAFTVDGVDGTNSSPMSVRIPQQFPISS